MRIKALTRKKEVVYILQFLELYGTFIAICVDNCGVLLHFDIEDLTVVGNSYLEDDDAN